MSAGDASDFAAGGAAGSASDGVSDAGHRPPQLLPWQAPLVGDLLARRACWPHALLLTGPEGIGKAAIAHVLAQALLCERPDATGFPCNACDSCHYVAAGQHPDLRLIEPFEVDDDGVVKPVEWIAVERVRALIDWVQLTSHRRMAKVAIVAPAERLNPAAANALLKTLEEPPPGTYVMLVSHQPGRLPATIASRCVRVAVPLPDAATATDWLAGKGVRNAGLLLAQAHGAPLRAQLLADPGYQAERAAWLAALALPRTLSPLALSARIDAAPRDERRMRLAAAIDWLLAWCADLAAAASGGTPSRNVDFADRIAALARSVARISLFRYHQALLRQRALLSHPLQPRLVAEALLIDYRALFD
jgi:DNA polymerase-3 subunit delta'